MKFLSFAFAIAFILQDHGTLQVDPIDNLSSTNQLKVFKKYYAYELVHAAVETFHRNEDIAEGGSECTRLIKKEDTNPIDAILAVMSIANDYYDQFKAIGGWKIFLTGIDAGLQKHIRDILYIIQRSVDKFPETLIDDYLDALKAYTLQHKGTSGYDRSVESAKKCYRSLVSIGYEDNKMFFEHLEIGFEDVGRILQYAGKEHAEYRAMLKDKLDVNTKALAESSLETPDSEDFHGELEVFVQTLNE